MSQTFDFHAANFNGETVHTATLRNICPQCDAATDHWSHLCGDCESDHLRDLSSFPVYVDAFDESPFDSPAFGR